MTVCFLSDRISQIGMLCNEIHSKILFKRHCKGILDFKASGCGLQSKISIQSQSGVCHADLPVAHKCDWPTVGRFELETDDIKYETEKVQRHQDAVERKGAANAQSHNDFLYI